MSRAVNFSQPLSAPSALPLLKIEILSNINSNLPILIVAPHPDDETLGCGGAIALLCQLNLPVEVLIISDGTKSHPNSLTYPAPALKKLRERESLAALAILGVKPEAVTFLALPDGAVPTIEQPSWQNAIALCRNYLSRIAPSLIFLPWRNDPHPDHRASWELLQVTSRDLLPLPRLIEYPIWDWDTEQRRNFSESVNAWRLDINSVLNLKQNAIAQYRSQISDLIDDDPEGFRLTSEMLQNFTQPWEIYIEVDL